MKMRVSSSSARVYLAVAVAIPTLLLFLALVHAKTLAAPKVTAGKQSVGASTKASGDRNSARVLDEYGKLPLAFEPNMGQTDAHVRYLTRGDGYELFLTPSEAVLALRQPSAAASSTVSAHSARDAKAKISEKASVVRLEMTGTNPSPAMEGSNELERKANYFTGNNPKNWVTGVPSYGRVNYKSIYPGVDLAFYGSQGRLEYDFIVSPGADARAIAFRLAGAQKIRVDERGNLLVGVAAGSVSFRKPVMYQVGANGERKEIAGKYLLAKNDELRFAVAGYDHSRTLVIDPVLDYSTYLGGSVLGDSANGVAVDGSGNAFVTGTTFNATFPLTTSPATTVGLGTPDVGITANGGAFVSEIDPTGTKELYFSYLSGDGGEVGYAIAVDPVANTTCENGVTPSYCVYVTGQTFSDTFPTNSVVTPYNAMMPTGGAPTGGNAFISKLNPYVSGATSLLYSSYLASTNAGDLGAGITVDTTQDAYITGIALAAPGAVPAFPILNGAQTAAPPAAGSAFLTVLNTTASSGALLYSSYLGGNDANSGTSALGVGDVGLGVVVDASKIAYLVGVTTSTNFPTLNSTGTYPNIKGWTTFPTGNTTGSGFVAAINTTLTGVNSLVYSTYVGGNTGELGNAIALAGSGSVFVTGQTTSTNFFTTELGTTAGAFPSPEPVLGSGIGVVFVTKLTTTANGAPPYSVLLGGGGGDRGNGIKVDTLGNVIVTGTTGSANFPITPGAFKSALTGPALGDAFVSKINPAGAGASDLLYSSYVGGSGVSPNFSDQGNGVALDSTGNAYITGKTYSSDFPVYPTPGPFTNETLTGTADAFLTKLTLIPVLGFSAPCTYNFAVTPTTSCALVFPSQTEHVASAAMTFVLTNNTSAVVTYAGSPITGANSADFTLTPTAVGGTAACTGTTLAAGASCGLGVTFTPSTAGAESATLTLSYTYSNGTSTPAAQSQLVALTGTGVLPTITFNPTTTLNFPTPQTVGVSSTLPVTVTNTGLGNLIFSAAPTASGDFAVATTGTTCTNGASIAQNGSCTINVTFTPTTTGARTGTLTITDNAAGSPQTINLTGTGTTVAAITATATPTTLAFGGQLVTTTSTAQVVTIKNTSTGASTLNITATPFIGGTNASDFAIASGSTCTSGATVAQNATCIINVTFTPPAGASGSRSATLSIADNSTTAPQIITLTGTAWDFTLSATGTTVAPGSSGTITVTVTGVGGFTGAVTLSCSQAIPQGSCTAPSSPVTAPGMGTVTVGTKGFVVPAARRMRPPTMLQIGLVLMSLMLLFTLPVTRRYRTRLGLAGAAGVLMIAAVGCGGSLPTPQGSYTVTITGTSGTLTHTTTATVSVT